MKLKTILLQRLKKIMSKRLSKLLSKLLISSFHYFQKSLIVLFATSDNISIALFAAVIGAPVGIASVSFSFVFSMSTGIVKKMLKT